MVQEKSDEGSQSQARNAAGVQPGRVLFFFAQPVSKDSSKSANLIVLHK